MTLLYLLFDAAVLWTFPALLVAAGFVLYRWRKDESLQASLRNFSCRALLVSLIGMPLLLQVPAPSPLPSLSAPIRPPLFSLVELIILLNSFVSAALLLRLAVGGWRIRSALRRSAHFERMQYAPRKQAEIRVLPSSRIPAALFFPRAVIFVPSDWVGWPPKARGAVLAHETAHLLRHDGVWQWLAHLAVALLPLHPCVWWLRRELLQSAEECCDGAVLDTGFAALSYAQLLVSLQSAKPQALPLTSAFCRPSLERRIAAILSSGRETQPRRPALAAAALGISLATCLAALGIDRRAGSMSNGSAALARHSQHAAFCWSTRDVPCYYRELKWLVRFHPEASAAGFGPPPLVVLPELGRSVAQAWSGALGRQPQSKLVAVHAGRWFRGSDPARALTLFRRAQSLPDLDSLHAQAVREKLRSGSLRLLGASPLPHSLRDKLVGEVNALRDPDRLAAIGTILSTTVDEDRTVDASRGLLVRAIEIQPADPRWREALESALAEPARRAAFRRLLSK